MKDWAIAFIAAAFLVGLVIWSIYIFLWALQ